MHFAITYDRSADDIKIYKDGSTVSHTKAGVAIAAIHDSSAPFELGDYNSGSEFDGLIDECGIWSRVLTAGEITDLYNSGAGLPYDAGGGGGGGSTFTPKITTL